MRESVPSTHEQPHPHHDDQARAADDSAVDRNGSQRTTLTGSGLRFAGGCTHDVRDIDGRGARRRSIPSPAAARMLSAVGRPADEGSPADLPRAGRLSDQNNWASHGCRRRIPCGAPYKIQTRCRGQTVRFELVPDILSIPRSRATVNSTGAPAETAGAKEGATARSKRPEARADSQRRARRGSRWSQRATSSRPLLPAADAGVVAGATPIRSKPSKRLYRRSARRYWATSSITAANHSRA